MGSRLFLPKAPKAPSYPTVENGLEIARESRAGADLAFTVGTP
jgi:hypothetical protein